MFACMWSFSYRRSLRSCKTLSQVENNAVLAKVVEKNDLIALHVVKLQFIMVEINIPRNNQKDSICFDLKQIYIYTD